MMKRSTASVILVCLIALSSSVAGCAAPSTSTRTPTSTSAPPSTTTTPISNAVIAPAPISDIRVDFLQTKPVAVSVYIKIGLRDTCTTFHDLATERSGNTVTITVTTEHQEGVICGQIYTFVEKNVNLGSDFVSGQSYTVWVNDQTTTFTMP